MPLNYLPTILVMAIGIPAMRAAKKKLILPRIGQVEFSQKRRNKFKSVNAFLIIIVILTWMAWLIPSLTGVLMNKPAVPYWFIDSVFGLLIFIFFVALSYTFETPRMIVYGLLFGLSIPADMILQETFRITFPIFNFLAGLVMTIWGSVTLIRFLRRYPLREEILTIDREAGFSE